MSSKRLLDRLFCTADRFDFKGILDYVLYSKTQMSVMGILGPLDAGWLQEHKVAGFPHPHVPSDHLPLLVELELTP